jgi:phosphatidylserine decarboxylase
MPMMLARGSLSLLVAPAFTEVVLAVSEIRSPNMVVEVCIAISIVILTGLLVFFRDPVREPGKGIVSPADGVVQDIVQDAGPPGSNGNGGAKFLKFQIFMNIHNVHVNRIPLDAKVMEVERRKGGFRPAFDKDAETNERVVYRLESNLGPVYLVQIAGAVARRIVPYVSAPAEMKKGERFGLIRLGSRVDLYLPEGTVRPAVEKGMKVKAGLDTIAHPLNGDDRSHEEKPFHEENTEDEE